MTTITFNKTNRIGDDVEHDVTAVARQFWASDEAKEWREDDRLPLERSAINWVLENYGGWNCADDWTAIYAAIREAMPRGTEEGTP